MKLYPLFFLQGMPSLSDVLSSTFRNLIEGFSAFVPRLIGTIVILVIGYAVARISSAVLKKVMATIGIDKIGDKINDIDFFKNLKIEVKISAIVSKVVYSFILLIFLVASADMLGVPAISNIVLMIVEFIPKVIAAGIMLIGGLLLADALKKFVITLCASFKIAAGKLIGSAVFFFFFVITVIAALGQAGINTTLLESSFSIMIAGIMFAFAFGYGLASKDILSNVLSSFYSRNKFFEGQMLEIDGEKGQVIKIDNTNLTLQLEGNRKVVYPLYFLQTKKVIIFD
jgi:small-conductance mechanosensitive channel